MTPAIARKANLLSAQVDAIHGPVTSIKGIAAPHCSRPAFCSWLFLAPKSARDVGRKGLIPCPSKRSSVSRASGRS